MKIKNFRLLFIVPISMMVSTINANNCIAMEIDNDIVIAGNAMEEDDNAINAMEEDDNVINAMEEDDNVINAMEKDNMLPTRKLEYFRNHDLYRENIISPNRRNTYINLQYIRRNFGQYRHPFIVKRVTTEYYYPYERVEIGIPLLPYILYENGSM